MTKLAIIKDLLISTQTTIRDIYGVSKGIGSDVSKIRVQILRTADDAVKSFKKVHDMIDGISVIVNALIVLRSPSATPLLIFCVVDEWLFKTIFVFFWTDYSVMLLRQLLAFACLTS